MVETLIDDNEIEYAMDNPPPDTRAQGRSVLIRMAKKNSIPFSGGWNYMLFRPNGHTKKWILDDPFDANPTYYTPIKKINHLKFT